MLYIFYFYENGISKMVVDMLYNVTLQQCLRKQIIVHIDLQYMILFLENGVLSMTLYVDNFSYKDTFSETENIG